MTAMVKHEGAIEAAGITPQSFNDVARMASALSKARGFVPDAYIGNPHALAAAIMTGLELGIGPMQALRSIHIVKGKPVLDASLMLSLAIRAGVRPQWLEQTAERAKLRLTRDGYEPHVHEYSMEDAKRAGLAGKDNYKNSPAAMLRARCVSGAMRAFCPDVLGSAVYVDGEIGDAPERPVVVDSDTGEVIDLVDQSAPQSIEEAIIEAEAVSAKAPTQMTECKTDVELALWIRDNAKALRKKGAPAITKVMEYADGIGIGDVASWVDAQMTEAA